MITLADCFREERRKFHESVKDENTVYRWDSALSHWQDFRNGAEGEEWDNTEMELFPDLIG